MALRQVTFHFPTDTQIRYLERRPRLGERVRGLDGEVFVVIDARTNGSGDVVTCVTPLDYDAASRRSPIRAA
jgi:hypothetical protein